MNVLQNLRTLTERWKEEAQRLRTLEAHGQAAALEQAARELDAELTRSESELLTIRQAAEESGYTEEHLRRLAREGALPFERNGGRGRLKVRRGDLPRKRSEDGSSSTEHLDYDASEDARDIARALRGVA
jgi:hypothetical protein